MGAGTHAFQVSVAPPGLVRFGCFIPRLAPWAIAFSGLVYSKRGRDASPPFYAAPTGLYCFLLLLPRAMPWATIFRPFGAERNLLYSNSEIGLVSVGTTPSSAGSNRIVGPFCGVCPHNRLDETAKTNTANLNNLWIMPLPLLFHLS